MKIGLLDHMGYGNLGDAATQEALISNIKARMPDVDILGFSLNPDDTRKRHHICAYSITHWHPGLNQTEQTNTDEENPPPRLKLILKGIPIFGSLVSRVLNLLRELVHLGRIFKLLRSLDILIIAGGGQLSELWRGPWSHPYNLFKFSGLAKLARKKLLILNVGAGPLNSSLGRMFIRGSVFLADYVSLRDVQSQALIQRIGVKRQTHVFPDSAYALDVSPYKNRNAAVTSKPLVGINPIGFCDPRIWPRQDAVIYSRYLDTLAAFSRWLLSHNYRLRIFSGEASVDVYALEDLKERLRPSLAPDELRTSFVPPSENVGDLFAQFSEMDFVVTSKFHGVVFSHLLAKPVLALSYHAKIDDLMRAAGHSEHCLNIESVEHECLEKSFTTLAENAEALKATFKQTAESYAALLKNQFDDLFVPQGLTRLRRSGINEAVPPAIIWPGGCRETTLTEQQK